MNGKNEQGSSSIEDGTKLVITAKPDAYSRFGFGELAFRAGLPATSGIVLLRVFPPRSAPVTALAVQVFSRDRDFRGLFVLAEEGRIRERALPPSGGRAP